MNTKVYLKAFCEKAQKEVPLSYEVIYFNKVPKVGICKLEYHNRIACSQCSIKGNIQKIVNDHFENIYKKEFDNTDV